MSEKNNTPKNEFQFILMLVVIFIMTIGVIMLVKQPNNSDKELLEIVVKRKIDDNQIIYKYNGTTRVQKIHNDLYINIKEGDKILYKIKPFINGNDN